MKHDFTRFYSITYTSVAFYSKIVVEKGEVCRMKPLKQSVSLTLDIDVLRKMKNLAESCDRSLSQYVNIVLKQHVVDNFKGDEV